MRDSNPYTLPTKDTVCSFEGYLYFVYEREVIRIAKETGWPIDDLTLDPILRKYKFTNIRRRDDRMSKWFLGQLINPFQNREDLWFTLLVARLINWPPTLMKLIEAGVLPCSPESFNSTLFVSTIEKIMKSGKKAYGGAYMVYPTMMNPGGSKSQSVADHIIGSAIANADAVHKALWLAGEEPSVERFVTALSQCFGISSFIAGQVAADLTYLHGHLGNAGDLYSWAPLGPGSQAGLNYMLEKPITRQWAQSEFNTMLIIAHDRVADDLGITDLTLHDIQSTFCEFGKYARTRVGDSTPKSLYKPEKAY